MTTQTTQLKAAIEAVVFASDQPVTTGALRKVFPERDSAEIKSALEALRDECEGDARGIELIEVAGGWAFRTKASFGDSVGRLDSPRAIRLSKPALETLAIVAYRQPVTRGGVEDIRGVDSGAVIKTLLERRLVRIIGKSDAVGNPILYGTTKEFLDLFNLKDLNALPTLQEFSELDDSQRALVDEMAPVTSSSLGVGSDVNIGNELLAGEEVGERIAPSTGFLSAEALEGPADLATAADELEGGDANADPLEAADDRESDLDLENDDVDDDDVDAMDLATDGGE